MKMFTCHSLLLSGLTLAAAVHEFGAPEKGFPPRPYFKAAIAKNKDKWPDMMSKGIAEAGIDRALDLVGATMADDIRNSIRDEEFTALKPATVNRKGFATPLIDTAHMVNSVDHDVTER